MLSTLYNQLPGSTLFLPAWMQQWTWQSSELYKQLNDQPLWDPFQRKLLLKQKLMNTRMSLVKHSPIQEELLKTFPFNLLPKYQVHHFEIHFGKRGLPCCSYSMHNWPPWVPQPPYVSTIIFLPVKPASPYHASHCRHVSSLSLPVGHQWQTFLNSVDGIQFSHPNTFQEWHSF